MTDTVMFYLTFSHKQPKKCTPWRVEVRHICNVDRRQYTYYLEQYTGGTTWRCTEPSFGTFQLSVHYNATIRSTTPRSCVVLVVRDAHAKNNYSRSPHLFPSHWCLVLHMCHNVHQSSHTRCATCIIFLPL